MNIEEYVQINVQRIRVIINPKIAVGANITIATRTIISVNEVYIERVIVFDIAFCTEVLISCFLGFLDLASVESEFKVFFFNSDLILSRITIVSLIEYHKIVRRAVIK